MYEDAQPNERPSNRKGGAVPIIRSTQAIGRGRGFQRGGYGHFTTRYHNNKPLNGSQTGTYPFVSSYHHQQYTHSSRRSRPSYDGPYAKRRRTDHQPNTEPHSRDESANIYLPKTPCIPRKFGKRKALHEPEPLELLVDIPPECRKGAPDCQRLRKEWQALQVQQLSAKAGVQLQFGGYRHDCARFIVGNDPDPRSAKRREVPTEEKSGPAPAPCAIDYVPTSDSSINPSHINEEIIIVENVDEPGDYQDLSVPSSPIQIDHVPYLRCRSPLEITRPTRMETPEPLEPLRVFQSGVFYMSSEGDGGPIAFETSSSTTAPPASLWPSREAVERSVLTDEIASMISEYPELAKESLPVPPATKANDHLPSTSTARAQASFNHEIDIQESCTNNEPSYQHELTHDDPFIQLPLQQSDKIRRILELGSASALAVSMRGSVDVIGTAPLRHQRTLKTITLGESIDDACLLRTGNEYITIFGHARSKEQLSWRRTRHDTNQSETRRLPRPWNSAKKGGVSAVTSMMQHLQFATGGYDHVVHLWKVESDLSSASPRPLAIKHTSQVQSLLAIRDTSHKLVSAGADCNVHIWDLSSERVVNTLRPSNATYHLHSTTSPFCTLLEIAHRELQFEVRDHRRAPESPILRFGYNTDKVHGRFVKG
ncbi:hypothetical protein D9615_000222 [Tricholomella constricta]|uniref:Uncharacterized protein n=1 Tax=Tricholomella constricta TaxID=117010 RepID=A0A8H5MBW5_9AGAR|nr:hypothetical protein D9615_000222 [Tricholomella constricta]